MVIRKYWVIVPPAYEGGSRSSTPRKKANDSGECGRAAHALLRRFFASTSWLRM